MHKDFYASGFLYNPKTQQILLQQAKSADNNNEWVLFGAEHDKEETLKEKFLNFINELLNLNLKENAIFPVYDYTDKGKNVFIFYVHVKKLEKFNHKSKNFAWFTFKQVQKLGLSDQTKQDIIVSQRVIDSSIRKGLGERTIG